MEALNAAEGSGFEFHMEEEEAAAKAAAAGGNDESDIIDMGEAAPAEPHALEDAPVELDPLEEPPADLDQIVDLEESEEKQ